MPNDPVFDPTGASLRIPAIEFTPLPRYDFTPAAALDPDSEMPRRFRSLVPENLLLCRHAPSELNVLNDLIRAGGELPPAAKALKEIPDNHARVAVGGDAFIKAAAQWVKENLNLEITVAHCSPFVRARETAGNLGKESGIIERWRIDSRIGERSYGDFVELPLEDRLKAWAERKQNPRYWTPPNGESMEQTEMDARSYIASVSSKYPRGTVFAVTHGEFMVATRCIIEYPSEKQLLQMIDDAPPNCGIIHYTRRDPFTGELASHYTWMRLVDPNGQKSSWDGRWRTIDRPTYSNDDLLAEISEHPRFFDFSTRKPR